MRKAELINKISMSTGIPKVDVLVTLETFFHTIKDSIASGENVHVRGFGSFVVKKKAKKYGRDIRRNITIEIPERMVPAFKPSKAFVNQVITSLSPQTETISAENDSQDDTYTES